MLIFWPMYHTSDKETYSSGSPIEITLVPTTQHFQLFTFQEPPPPTPTQITWSFYSRPEDWWFCWPFRIKWNKTDLHDTDKDTVWSMFSANYSTPFPQYVEQEASAWVVCLTLWLSLVCSNPYFRHADNLISNILYPKLDSSLWNNWDLIFLRSPITYSVGVLRLMGRRFVLHVSKRVPFGSMWMICWTAHYRSPLSIKPRRAYTHVQLS